MRHASGDLNPAQAIAQRMRAMETELQQARQALRRELNLEYDQLERGILHVYTQPDAFAQAGAG